MDALAHFHVLLLSLDVLQALAQSKHRLLQWREVFCTRRRDREGSGTWCEPAGNRQGTRHEHTTRCMARLVIVVGISRLIHLHRQRPGRIASAARAAWRGGKTGISPTLTGFGNLFSLAALAQHEGERNCFRSYSGHGVAEAKAEDARLMRDERETALGLLLHAVNGPVVRPDHLHDSGVRGSYRP